MPVLKLNRRLIATTDFHRFKVKQDRTGETTLTADLTQKYRAVNHPKLTTCLLIESLNAFWKTSNLVNEKLKQNGIPSFFSQSAS